MLGLARCQRAPRRRDRDLAIDTVARQHQPPRAELPRLELGHQLRHQQVERLARRLGMDHRLGQPQQGARHRLERRRGERLVAPPERAVERVERIVGLAKPPRQAPPLDPGERADRLQPQPLERSRHPRRQPQRRHGQWRKQRGEPTFPLPVGEFDRLRG